MYVTEVGYYVLNLVKKRVSSKVQLVYDICWLLWRLARAGLGSIVILPLGIVWDVCGDLLRLLVTLACIWAVVILISFIKSLSPRYNFYHEPTTTTSHDSHEPRGLARDDDPRDDVFSPTSSRRSRPVSANSGWPIKRFVERKFPLLLKLWTHLRTQSKDVNQICTPALSVPDIDSVYKRLSWAHTQVDIESVNWINQTLRTLWPSIKTLLNIFLFNELLKPKRPENKNLAKESKKLAQEKPKLSVYISSRRKLDLIKKIEATALNRYQSLIDRSIFRTTIFVLKLAIVYMKQFLIDYVCYLFQGAKKRDNSLLDDSKKKIEIKLEKLLKIKEKIERAQARDAHKKPRSWNGYGSVKLKRERKLKSAPPQLATKNITMGQGLLGPRTMRKLRDRRLKLAEKFKQAYEKSQDKNELTIERIQLGDSIPMINGLKYIDECDDLVIDPVRTTRHLVGSDERNMRFVSEFSYATDDKFQIKLSLHPLLGQIRLVNLKVQIRCYLTLNHTVNELNRDLKIFETPDDVLFPAINYVQLSLVDVPSFDWELDRPSRRRKVSQVKGEKKKQLAHRVMDYMSRLIDPVDIVNHSYFKYIVRSIVHMSLKWFQPFDIRIGPHIYLKTIC